MLNSIRSSVNSTLTRVILFIAAIAFAFSGVGMLGSGRGNYDIISFYKLPNIKLKLVDNFDKSERGTKGFGSTGK